MQEETPTRIEVVEATPKDADCIVAWLKSEYDQGGQGFWCNRNLIYDALDGTGELWVVRRKGVAVAFQLGRYSASILSVRKDYRGMGLGRVLVGASIDRAIRDDVNVLSVECEPKESLGFWQRMGFVKFEKREQPGSIQARRVLSRIFDLPSPVSPVDVMVAFYPESAIHGSAKTVRPIVEHRVVGARADDGSIMLGERIIGLNRYGNENGDTVVKIEVEGVVHCFCKAKHEPAQLLGVRRDWLGGTYFIDTVRWDRPIE